VPKLSRREAEVAQLVADGLTNREIAARLFISERTAEYHVEQIRNKLGVHSRHEITASASAVPPSHLPAQLTSFVGRRRDLEGVSALLAGTRLVTIIGAGGTGKTRLALEVAVRLAGGFPDGAWFVDLQSLEDPALLEPELAAALAVTDPERELAAARRLVVLDNCEQLAEACRELAARLLGSCPQLHILATSREPLRVPGEAVWTLNPLPAEEAVSLFLDRARMAAAEIDVAAADPALVASICEDLDRIPLAIELAASRARVMSLPDIRERLKNRFRVLVDSGARAPRQRSLAATVAWSYELLNDAERDVFRKLGVFAGGFRLDSAEAVIGPGVAEVLDRLVETSMVVAERAPDRPTRYRLLVTLRDYARERLLEADARDEPGVAHMRRFAELARRAYVQTQGRDQAAWLQRIDDELDEYRAAIDRALETEPGAAVTIAGGLTWFWGMRGRVDEGRRVLAAALARPGQPSLERGVAIIASGWLARLQGDVELGVRFHAESVEMLRRFDDPVALGTALVWNAEAASSLGDWATAQRGWEEAIELLTPSGTSLPLGYAHMELAMASVIAKRPDRTRAFVATGLAMMEALGNVRAVALCHLNLAQAALLEGKGEETRRELLECLTSLNAAGARADVIWPLDVAAELLVGEGDAEGAVLLAGAAQALRQETGRTAVAGNVTPETDATLKRARAELGEAAYEGIWARGLAMDPEQAMDLIRVKTPS